MQTRPTDPPSVLKTGDVLLQAARAHVRSCFADVRARLWSHVVAHSDHFVRVGPVQSKRYSQACQL